MSTLLCYAIVVSPKQKFDSRAQQCIFISYPLNKKTYKLFDIVADTFFTSRDFIFHESFFPSCQQSQTQSSPPFQGILPTIDIDLPTPVQHSLDQPSSHTRHNAPEPPANQPSSPTRHNAPEPQQINILLLLVTMHLNLQQTSLLLPRQEV